jgi:hypothetical protein
LKRLNFTLDDDTVQLLSKLSQKYYEGNKSQTVRAALESLATHASHDGWVITGYTTLKIDNNTPCHTCGKEYNSGDMLYKPVFERGVGSSALKKIPEEDWVECHHCVEEKF